MNFKIKIHCQLYNYKTHLLQIHQTREERDVHYSRHSIFILM